MRGINGSFLSFVLNYVVDVFENTLLAVLPDTEQAEKLADDLQSLMPQSRVLYFPQAEVVPFDQGSFAPALHSARLNALVSLLENPVSVLVTTPTSLIQKIERPENIKKQISHIRRKDRMDRDFLLEWLVESGFERVSAIEEIGQFSARGGIVDIFSYEAESPVRLEFFDDEIESIREFDILSQVSIRQLEKTRIVGKNVEGDRQASLFDYLPANAILFWEDPERCHAQFEDWIEHSTRLFTENAERSSDPAAMYLFPREIQNLSKTHRQIFHSHLQPSQNNALDFNVQPPQPFQGNIKLLGKYLSKRFRRTDRKPYPLFIVYEKTGGRDRLEEFIEEEMGWLPPVRFLRGDIHSGFSLPEVPLEV
ncbi:MAG: hypothetical protein WAN36_12315, partial [Calditrichia bacterium]